MKKHNSCFVWITVFMLIPLLSFSQIEITWPYTPPEKTVTVDVDTSVILAATSMNLSLSGEDQNWTFTHVMNGWNDINIETINLAGDPNAGAFPDAEWIQKFDQFFPEINLEIGSFAINIPAQLAKVTQYQRINNGFIEELGSDIEYSLLNSGQGGPFIYPDPATVYPNPMVYGSASWTEKRYIEGDITYEYLILKGSLTDSSIVEVDAWGTLNLNGTDYPCLRLKYNEFRKIHIDPIPFVLPAGHNITFESYTYSWINEDFEVILELSSDALSGETFAIADLVIAKQSDAPNGIECDPCRTVSLPEKFVLEQNYPNPFNPTTQFQYTVSQPAEIQISIFNVLGQPVVTINEGLRSIGTYQINWEAKDANGSSLSNGIYLYHLQARAMDGSIYTQKRKMILSK